MHMIFVGKRERKSLAWIPRRRWEVKIKNLTLK